MLAAAPAAAYDSWNDTARYEFTYTVDVSSLGAPRAVTRLWIPLAGDTAEQSVVAGVTAPVPHRVTQDAYGNRIAYLEWRGPAPGAEVVLRFQVTRGVSRGVPASEVRPGGSLDPARYREPARKIPLDGVIRALGEQESRGLSSDAEKIRAFYDYVVHHMKYSKQGEGWGQGDAVWACASKYGNCTDFHSVFIGMARSQGIPARFVIGFPIAAESGEGAVAGYHCWSEAWEPGVGWRPLDASEAWKSKRPDAYFGTLPSDRVQFSVGRDLVLEPPQAGEPLNYFIYPYAEVDGVPVEKVPARFHFRRDSDAPVARAR